MNSSIATLSARQLRHAADIKEKIELLLHELNLVLGVSNSTRAVAAPKKKRKMSAAGKARIVAAQKARWAKVKGAKLKAAPARKRKPQMTAAARAKISAAQKIRWSKIKTVKKAGA